MPLSWPIRYTIIPSRNDDLLMMSSLSDQNKLLSLLLLVGWISCSLLHLLLQPNITTPWCSLTFCNRQRRLIRPVSGKTALNSTKLHDAVNQGQAGDGTPAPVPPPMVHTDWKQQPAGRPAAQTPASFMTFHYSSAHVEAELWKVGITESQTKFVEFPQSASRGAMGA